MAANPMSTIPGSDLERQFPAGTESDVRVNDGNDGGVTKIRNWRVIHACEYARDVLPVVEGQVMAGMRPYIVTPQGAGSAELYLSKKDQEQRPVLSLLRAWHDVRNWRKSLLECDPETTADVVHAHSFAAGMTAVRGFPCVVYDLCACIEDWAIASGQCDHGSWMGRSFRVAEQFVLSRAQAVVVHSPGMKRAVAERGAPHEAVFVIPEPLDFEPEIPKLTGSFFAEELKIPPGATSYFVPQFANEKDEALPAPALAVLEAFALIVAEVPTAMLLLGASGSCAALLKPHLERLGIGDRVVHVEDDLATDATRYADVVVAIAQPSADDGIQQPNRVFLEGLRLGKALLAADVPSNREVSPEGRGCLWFSPGDVRDLSHRMAFLGSNPDFRSALAASGKAWILETRNIAAVGKKYDAAYRFALNRKKARNGGPGMTSLQPIVSVSW
jgi:glycosyltransferase involved in cell wall biosynthesis